MAYIKGVAKALLALSFLPLDSGLAAAELLKSSCINRDCTAKRLTISNPPVNLWDYKVILEFNTFMTALQTSNTTKVVVFSSDTPGFWASPIDLNLYLPAGIPGVNVTDVLDKYFENLDLLESTPVIFVGEVDGRAWAAGNEHLLRMDMRFAGPAAEFSAPEVVVGITHVGGLQQLTRLIGPGRTAEYMLSAAQVSATEAERVGWVNSAFSTATTLRNHVDQLAVRIALFNLETLQAVKASIAEQAPPKSAFNDDLARFNHLATLPLVQENLQRVISLSQNQSKSWEENNSEYLVRQLY